MAHLNRAYFTISNTPGGSGDLTVSTAVAGPYRTMAEAQDGIAYTLSIVEGTTWEIRSNCVYTHSGTSLSRGTLEDSSTGSAITLTSAAKVMVVEDAAFMGRISAALQGGTPGGRLTGLSNSIAGGTDATTSIYYTPYLSNVISLWDGVAWIPVIYTEKALALGTVVSGKGYDVFGYLSAGELTLELGTAWETGNTRAAGAGGISLQNGRFCKGTSGGEDKTRLYLGSFYTISASQTRDSARYRYLWNMYNRIPKDILYSVGESTHTGNLGNWRYYNNSVANSVYAFTGLGDLDMDSLTPECHSRSGAYIGVGVGSSNPRMGYASSGAAVESHVAGSSVTPQIMGLSAYSLTETSYDPAATWNWGAISGSRKC